MKLRCLLSICLFIAFSSTAQELQKPVRLKTGTLTRANNIQRERNMTAALRPVQYKNSYYTLIQFNKLPGKQQRQQLEKEGISCQVEQVYSKHKYGYNLFQQQFGI